MRVRIDNCYYDLVKDLLMSQNTLIKDVQKDGTGTIVTLQSGTSEIDLISFLSHEPILQFCKNSAIHIM